MIVDAFEDAVDVATSGFIGRVGFAAGGEFANEALSDNETDGVAKNRIGANHINHAGEGGGAGIGMKGGEDEVAGDGGLDGGAGGVGVTNFAYHDDVRVEAEDRAEIVAKGTTMIGVDRNLGDASNAVFNRVFESDDFAVGGIEGIDNGIEGGGFTGASGANHEDETAGMGDDFTDGGTLSGSDAEKVEIE